MTIKKISIFLGLFLFLVVATFVAIHFFRTSKQVYDGVLVYNHGVVSEQQYEA